MAFYANVRWDFQNCTDYLVDAYPHHLRTGFESISPRQEGERADVTTEVRPLTRAKPAINRDEEIDWSIEKLKISLRHVEVEPSGLVVSIDAQRTI